MPELKKTLVERLFAEHAGSLEAFFFRRVRRHPDAADLAQEVYARMMRVSDMEAVQNPEAYLYTVASNLAREHARGDPAITACSTSMTLSCRSSWRSCPLLPGNWTPSSGSSGCVRCCRNYLQSVTPPWSCSTGMG